MFNQNQISITQVSNGWMVILPFQPKIRLQNDEHQFRMQARIIKEEIQGDDILKQIEQSSEPEFLETPLSEIKENNISVFKTFDEVLAFLSYKIKP